MLLLAAAVLAATPATLSAQLANAQPGDQLQLAPGDYGLVQIVNRRFAPALKISAGQARLQLHIMSSSGVELTGGQLLASGTSGPAGYASLIRQSDHVSFTNVNFPPSVRAMVIDRSTNVTVKGGTITGMTIDGINIAASQNVLIDGVTCQDFQPLEGTHPDCVQLWSRKELPITADVTVQNVVSRGNMQGVTAFNHPERGDPGFDRIHFLNNKVEGAYPQGVALYDARNSVVTGNRTTTIPGSRFKTSVNVVRCTGCTVANNVSGPKR
ncbi:MAG: right-handed parallel beta-helix repeat-containing protein [Sphingomonadales bacterium]